VIYYIYNGSELLGFVYKNKTYYYHKNMFGDIIGILDSSYNEIVTYGYDSWGALVNITDSSNINLGTINPFRYRSYYYDEESGFYYLNSRYYNPKMGRFINADLVITGQEINSVNIFIYCGNNPVGREDANGDWFIFKKTEPKKYKKVEGYSLFGILKEKIFNKKKDSDLQNSTQNCYTYATGLENHGADPGYNSGHKLSNNFSVDELKDNVIADLNNVGRRAREVSGPNSYLNPDEYMIAMRITENPILFTRDYHFMMRDDDGVWSEKKGLYSSNKVMWTPESFGAWSPRMNSKTVYLAITK